MTTPDNARVVRYFGEPMKVACDQRCTKAWGINTRPRVFLSDDPEDFAWLADDELGEAPADPGTYEGTDGKPTSPAHFPNTWCVRECERCAKSALGAWMLPLVLKDFSRRVFNDPAKHPHEDTPYAPL
jgi:hypothetical protein